MPEMGIGEVSVSALWPLARKPPCMQHPRIKMVRCAGTLPATFGHARRRMDVLAYSHGSGARPPGMAPHGSHVDAGWPLLPAAASSPLAAGLRKAACAGIEHLPAIGAGLGHVLIDHLASDPLLRCDLPRRAIRDPEALEPQAAPIRHALARKSSKPR